MATLDIPEEPQEEPSRVLIQLETETGEKLGGPFDVPLNLNNVALQSICNALTKQDDDDLPYAFFVENVEITETVEKALFDVSSGGKPIIKKPKWIKQKDPPIVIDTEKTWNVVCHPQAVFKVDPVTRCTTTISGHAEPIIALQFSPDGRSLATGSGDMSVRFYDLNTETPRFVGKIHRHWVLVLAWSPNGLKLASACKNGEIVIWDPESGTKIGQSLTGHKTWVTALCWEPLHLNGECRRLASASKDGTVRIWDVVLGQTLMSLTSHSNSVRCIRWNGTGLIYSGSEDRTIKVWRVSDGVLCRLLEGHAHWVNSLALNVDYVMRTGAFDPRQSKSARLSPEEARLKAETRYNEVVSSMSERLISCSDDFTLILWNPSETKKPIARMTGHQGIVNDVKFSPDGRWIASASFDKSTRLWDGKTGQYLATFRGHVRPVYQIAWSADSRLLVSGSADSTLKLWSMKTRKLTGDLPGHADAVFAVDWSPDGERVASGGQDRVLKIWRK